MKVSAYAAFVSSVEGHAVARFGSAIGGRHGELIGATRDPVDPTRITWDTSEVVPLTATEWAQFRREYERAIRNGALQRRAEAEYVAFAAGDGGKESSGGGKKPARKE